MAGLIEIVDSNWLMVLWLLDDAEQIYSDGQNKYGQLLYFLLYVLYYSLLYIPKY
jgi:hypothetical protein